MEQQLTSQSRIEELIKKYDRPGPRYTSYPTVPEWTTDVNPGSYADALRRASEKSDEPISVYMHLPFCEKRCYFCACNVVIPTRKREPIGYIEAVKAEINITADLLKERNQIIQLHFGGGTPTYLTIPQFTDVLGSLESRFELLDDAEISIEVDPRVTSDEQFKFLASRGFNRISMGVQDFDPKVQKSIGRIQPFDLTKHCVEYARACGFSGINLDLIYGLPDQTIAGFSHSIAQTIELKPDRIALYSFAYFPDSMNHHRLIKQEQLPSVDIKAELFFTARRLFSEAGYQQIGMDHFALPEDELALAQNKGILHRNFMGYTTKIAPDLVGLGVSGIGYVSDTFAQNHSTVEEYQGALSEKSLATHRGLKLSSDDLIRQYVISTLMCNFALNFETLENKFNVRFGEYFGDELSEIDDFIADGILTKSDTSLSVTLLGRTFVRNVAMMFDAYLRNPVGENKATFSRTI